MEYLLKASAVVTIFYLCYKLFLQRETFFESNRWFLLTGLIVAFAIPFIVIPIYVTAEPLQLQNILVSGESFHLTEAIVENPFSILELIIILYVIGIIFFLGRFILQFGSLGFLLLNNKGKKKGRYTFIKTNSNSSPFSFFKWIVYNPNQFNEEELHQIITHEKIHASQYHSLDIILTQLASIIFWFNPFIWLYKKELQQNLEFIADQTTQEKFDCKKTYQHLLLKTSVPNYQMALTNNFYNSLIKKRIFMLHKNRSKNRNHWKFTLILPILALFIMSFNTKEITIEDASSKIIANNINTAKEIVEVIITKDYSEADFKKIKETFAEAGFTLKFKGIKRNENGEITAIKIEANSKNSNANFNTNSDDPIKPIKVTIDNETNSISIGNGSDHHFGKGEGFSFISKDGNHKIHTSGKGNNTFFFKSDDHDDDDDHDNVFIIKKNGKVHEVQRIHSDKKVHTIISDNVVIDIDSDHDIEIDGDTEIRIITEDGNIVKREIIGGKHKNIWITTTTESDKSFKVETIGKGTGNKVFFSNSGDKNPLFILNGKEVSKDKIDALDSNTIDKIEVLKGENATKEYGKKGKDGVVVITTKKKE